MLKKFFMRDSEPVNIPLASHFILIKDKAPRTNSKLIEIENIPYENVVGSIMYLMVSSGPDIAYNVSCLSMYMSIPGKAHYEALNG